MPTVTIQPGDRGADFTVLTGDIKAWLLDNGVKFVCRYVVPPEYTKINKDLKAEELDWYAEHDIAVISNFERSHNDATRSGDKDSSFAYGRKHGTVAADLSRQFGFPYDAGVWVSVDEDIWKPNLVLAEAYVRGFSEAIGDYRLGLYGDSDIAWAVRDLDPLVWRPAAGAWDREARHVNDHIRQHVQVKAGSSSLDPNTCLLPFTAWIPGTESPAGTATRRRVIDTRDSAPLHGREVREVVLGVPGGSLVALTLQHQSPLGGGWLRVWGDGPEPATSDVLGEPDWDLNTTIVRADKLGRVRVRSSHGGHVIVDLTAVLE